MHDPRWTLAAVLLTVGCTHTRPAELVKPPQPPEIARLQGLVGTWYGTAELVYPEPEYPADDTTAQVASTYMKGGFKCEWMLGGLALECQGWHDVPGADRANYTAIYRWDPLSRRVRVWYLSDYGEHGDGTLTISEDNRTLTLQGKGLNAEGRLMNHTGEMNFIAEDRIEWSWTEKGTWWWDKIVIQGTSRKQR